MGSNYGGAICVSEISNASIESCSFVNCSAKYGGAITFTSSDNSSTVNYCIFANNMATSNGNDIYTKAPLNANYNYWGKNTGADESSVTLNLSSVICDRWVILDVEADLSKVAVGENIQFGFDLTKYTDGVAVYSLDKLLPELLIDLTCDLGTFSPASFMTVDGMANTTYTPLYNGSETVNVNVPTTSLSFTFDVLPSSDNLIFVSIEGSDSTGDGSESNPFRTIEKALTQVTEAKDTIYIKKGTYKEHDLSITENVRIIGENEDIVIIDGEKAGRIFAISEDAEVFFKFLTLTNGKVNYDDEDYETGGKGGAILIDGGDLTLNKVKIFNSTAAAGGAIANIGYSSKLIIQDSLFDGNSLDSEAGDYYFDILSGAAIYSDSSLVITNTTFSNNDADTEDYSTDGGAIAILSSATISNCSFTNNSASGYGGAIAIDAFNTASIILINNIFDSNNALSGGAIYSCLSKLTSISENSFTNNSAVNYGGAIYVFGLKTIDVIDNNNFTSNCAKYGPSIALKYASSTLIANLFEENYNSGISSLDNSIYVDSANVGTSNLTFLNNDTIYVVKGDSVNLTAVLSDEDGNPICNANISFLLDGEPVGNAITDNMGIATLLYNTNQTLNSYLVSGSFAGSNENYTSNVKSGILKVSKYYWFIGSQGYFTLQDAVDASGEGDTIIGLPGVYAYEEVSIGDRMKKIHKNVTIKAEALGEIIMTGVNGRLFNVANKHSADNIQAPSALVLENLIIENCSDEYGGAIYNDAYLTIINCILRNNHATTTEASSKFQGATIMSWGDLKIINSTFINNTGLSGSAINSDTLRGNLSVIDSIFIGNIANESTGGAIFASGGTTDHAYLRNCTFINNTADCGGAIFSIVDMTIEDSHFINNTASEQSGAGGAIYSSKSDLNLDNVYIEGSSAS